MKSKWMKIFFIFLFTFAAGAWSRQPFKIGETLYNLTVSGLNMRDQPSKTGKVVALVPFGAQIKLVQTTEESLSVDNIAGKWIEAEYNGKKGFVFDGYLTSLKPPAQNEKLNQYAERIFQKNGLKTVNKDDDGEITVQHYKNGAVLTYNTSSISSITELAIPGISVEEGFLLLRLLAEPIFRNEPFPAGNREYNQKIEQAVWETSVNVQKSASGEVTNIEIMKGPGVSLGFRVFEDSNGIVTLFLSYAD